MTQITATEVQGYEKSAAAIAHLVDDTREILEGLLALRAAEGVNDFAIAAVMSTPAVNRIRLGWELFEVLTEGAGIDSESMLLKSLHIDDYVLTRAAIWAPQDELAA